MLIYGTGILTAGLTAFYMFRLYYLIFWNKPATAHEGGHHKEADASMLIALCLLGVGTVFAGFIPFSHYISSDGKLFDSPFHLSLALVAIGAGVTGILIATGFYLKKNDRPEKFAAAMGGLLVAARSKFYIDEIYLFVTKKIIFSLISAPAAWIDKNIVDRTMILAGDITAMVSDEIKTMQSGKVYDYVLYFFIGVIAISVLVVFY